MGYQAPKFPNTIWDGSSVKRPAPVSEIDHTPEVEDWDQITSEVIALENATAALQTATAVVAWTDITLTNGWTNKASNAHLGYKMVGTHVSLRGVIVPGTMTNGTSVGTLPLAARPTNKHSFPVVAAGGDTNDTSVVTVLVGTDGTLKVYGVSASTSLDLSPIQFHTDA